jgi:hypothetical protein
MLLPIASTTNVTLGSLCTGCSHLQPAFAVFLQYSEKKNNLYTILWALVFGFATLNILGLVTRRLEPDRTRLSFGETLAIIVVAFSVFLLGWEMLYLFKVLPIKLKPHEP